MSLNPRVRIWKLLVTATFSDVTTQEYSVYIGRYPP